MHRYTTGEKEQKKRNNEKARNSTAQHNNFLVDRDGPPVAGVEEMGEGVRRQTAQSKFNH